MSSIIDSFLNEFTVTFKYVPGNSFPFHEFTLDGNRLRLIKRVITHKWHYELSLHKTLTVTKGVFTYPNQPFHSLKKTPWLDVKEHNPAYDDLEVIAMLTNSDNIRLWLKAYYDKYQVIDL
jgi:hypothetical protein